ncbi:dipeptidase [Paenibacillus sp. HB172176]|uniref:dipeptidase n=1 Tax=Paenibacillus sp. HB172176 TaxID=2493690 RepID=UPI0014399034|nr:dipeptidase [Paenibacillus sp. HB172176]
MNIIDFHCDALLKMLENKTLTFDEAENEGVMDVTYERLREAGTLLQTFAIFIPPEQDGDMVPILESIDIFYEKVLSCERMMLVRTAADLEACLEQGKTGALLSLEGVGGLQGNLSLLRLLHRLGVRAAGLTWNHANWAADGVMEPRGGGLTLRGREFVKECERLGIIVDVSHLSEQAFWDVEGLAQRPFIASHSNAKAICDHPRNLTDDQLKATFSHGGRVGVTYVPYFVAAGKETVEISDLLRHIDYMCGLGGEPYIMLGSDFDGIASHISGLTHPGQVETLREALLQNYTEEQVKGFMHNNALAFLRSQLTGG